MSNKQYIAPPWIKYPTYPKKSDFWRMGSGADYLIKFNQNVKDKEEYYKMFPKAPTFKDDISSKKLSGEAMEYIMSDLKPLFIKLWTMDAKPKYGDVEFIKDNTTIMMYDTIYNDTSAHIHIGTKVYSSAKEIIDLVENEVKKISPNLWDELKYTLYLNALYYKIVTDINFIKELIKTNDRQIIFKSDNLEWGVEVKDDKVIGENLFGLAMMEIRDVLCEVYKNYDLIDWDVSGEAYSKERCSCGHVHTKK